MRNILLYLFCGRLLLLLSFFNFMEKSRFKRLMSNLSHHPSDPGFCSWHLTNYRRSGNPPFIFPSALHSSKYTSEVSSSKLRICIWKHCNVHTKNIYLLSIFSWIFFWIFRGSKSFFFRAAQILKFECTNAGLGI